MQGAQQDRLRANQLGVGGIVFMVLAAAGPLAAMFVGVAASIGEGNGIGTPGVYVLAGLTLALFAVGYVAMSRHVVNAGAFYAYVTRGLGRPAGFATAAVALLAYNAYVIALLVFVGLFAHESALSTLHVDLPWQAWSVIAFALLCALAYFQIELSAKVLGVLLACEFLVLATLDVAVLLDQGPGAFTLQSFAPSHVFAGALGVSIIYAFSSFTGFEATAIYGEEARNPRRTVPRATYLAVAIISAFYVLTTWSLVAAYGADHAVAAAQADPEGFVFAANARYVGGFTDDAMSLLICTSLFAALLAFHNATARYMFALARDHVLPRALTRTHPRHGSPYVASAVQLTITATFVAVAAIAGLPEADIAAGFLGLGAVCILLLQALASVSVVGFFRGHPERDVWRTLVAPSLAAVALSAAIVLAIVHYPALTGTESPVMNHLWWAIPVVLAAGAAVAVRTRRTRPDVYAAFGHGGVETEAAGVVA